MKDKQNETFFRTEADNYYKRNKNDLLSLTAEKDVPLRILDLYKIVPKKVLEIGCMNGYRLNFIKKKYNAECIGVEPSKEAVDEGNKLFKDIKLIRGIFSDIPLNEKFDLIIINFVFHWVDRDLLAKCVSEVERMLSYNGFLIIGDFFPDHPRKNEYTHLLGNQIWTYKQDYSKIFLSLENYSLIALLTSSFKVHDFFFEPDDNERKSYTLLWKREKKNN